MWADYQQSTGAELAGTARMCSNKHQGTANLSVYKCLQASCHSQDQGQDQGLFTRPRPRTNITVRKPTTCISVRVSVHVAITDYPISVFYVRSTYWIFIANTAANYEI